MRIAIMFRGETVAARFAGLFLPFLLTASLAAQTAEHSLAFVDQTQTPAITSIDAREIVRRSVAEDHKNWLKARKYTWQERRELKHLDKHGDVKSQEIKTYDTTYFYDEEYSRLVAINDKPLDEKEQNKEEEKQQKFIAKYRDESEDEHRKRLEKQGREREEQRAFIQDIVNAYDFKLWGEEQLEGHATYVIEATPRKDFHPTQPHGDLLAKIQGRLWIDKREYQWVKLDAQVIDTISFGLFLARIHKGAHISVQWTRVNDEVWLPRHFFVNASARIALVTNEAFEQQSDFSKFQKFAIDTKILPGVQEMVAMPTPTP